jgi:transcriptional regulator with XRE-family HTH domain
LVQTNLLKGRIVASGLSRKELASKAHMSESTLSDKINGKRSFTTDEVEIICDVLGIDTCEDKVNIFLHSASQN